MIICGDSANILPMLATNSVDLTVTDPPYGWEFMGKDWDKAVPSVAIWKQCLRVLKPGAFAFVMSGPRMDCLSEMGKRLAEAGFETAFSPIFWAYASGFPKAANMGKLVDKRLGAEREVVGHEPQFPDGTRGATYHGQARGDGIAFTSRDESTGLRLITAPATSEAQALDGSYAGFQPKPAVEVVIVAMKPLEHGTYIDQALDNQKGITWLDDGRIPYESDDYEAYVKKRKSFDGTKGSQVYGAPSLSPNKTKHQNKIETAGRFPANLLISDDAVDDGREIGGGKFKGATERPRKAYFDGLGQQEGASIAPDSYGDSGSFSRYFSLDAWWAERLERLPESARRTFPFLVVSKASKAEKEMGLDGLEAGQKYKKDGSWGSHEVFAGVSGDEAWKAKNPTLPTTNRHPTVKPLKLMSYLIMIGSRPGDLVLDPFAGTCTTGMAAKMLGCDYLMIEIDEQWCQIGQRRIDAIQEQLL